jgi:predicted aspartyl protease
MKIFTYLFFDLVLSVAVSGQVKPAGAISFNQPVSHAPLNSELNDLLSRKEYFKLEARFTTLKEIIDRKQQLYFRSYINNAFNRHESAIAEVDSVLKLHSDELSDSAKAGLFILQADSYFKQYRYGFAAQNDSIVLSKYSAVLDSSLIKDIKNQFVTANALRYILPQEVNLFDGTTVEWKKDRMGLIEIPVKINNQVTSSVFDTKANFSCVTQSYAAKLGLHILDASIEEGSGITGIRFLNGLGVADSLYIGNIVLRNVVFLVMPDDKLRFGSFSIHMIIGYPLMQQLGEIQFNKNGKMVVPSNNSESGLHNLVMDGLSPVVSLMNGEDTLGFHLDLGAQNTSLYATYFEKYHDLVMGTGKKKSVSMGGAGGSRKKEIYLLPEIRLATGNKNVSLRNINVFTEKLAADEKFYGNIGEDFIDQLEGFVINFRSMFFKVL